MKSVTAKKSCVIKYRTLYCNVWSWGCTVYTFTLWYVLPGSSDLKKCRNLKWIVDTTIAYPRGEAPNGLYLIFSRGKFPPIRVHYRVFDIKSVPRDEEGFKNWMYDRYIEKEAMLERFYKTGSLVDNLTESIDTDVKGAFFSVLFYFVMAVCFSVFLYFPVISLVNFKWILLIVLIYMIYFAYSFVKTFFWWINAVDIISIFLFYLLSLSGVLVCDKI